MTKAELERLMSKRKQTKKGKRNRALLLKQRTAISSAELINYMEKKKTQLRKVKAQSVYGGKDKARRKIVKPLIYTRHKTGLR